MAIYGKKLANKSVSQSGSSDAVVIVVMEKVISKVIGKLVLVFA